MSFESDIVLLRNRFERSAVRLFYNAIAEQYNDVLFWIEKVPVSVLKNMLDEIIKPDPVETVINSVYSTVGAKIGGMYRAQMMKQKAEGWDEYFDSFILPSMLERNKHKIKSITSTTSEYVRELISTYVDDGMGIDMIRDGLMQQLNGIGAGRAKTIAQTEVISASNQAAFASVKDMGIKFKKYWSTSGLQGIRDSHLYAESWSYGMDGIGEDDIFEMGNGNKMKYPGDPDGAAEEVINCRCTLITLPVY